MKIPKKYLQKINPLIDQARVMLEAGERLAPMAFIGNLELNKVIILILDDDSDESKDASAKLISRNAANLNADFVLQIREAWMLSSSHKARNDEILSEHGSVASSPYARDVAAFSMETTHGTWIATMPIKKIKGSETDRTINPVNFEFIEQIQGRFFGLLPVKKSMES